MMRAILLLVLTLTLPTAAAQSVLDPLIEHATGEAEAAQTDSQGYAQRRASPDGVQEEAAWASDYLCYVRGEVAAGSPDAGLCPVRPAVDAGPSPEPEPVAEAVPVDEIPIAEVEEAVEEILEDPKDAPFILVALVQDLIEGLGTVIGGLAAFVGQLMGGAVAALAAVAGAAEDAIDGTIAAVTKAGESVRSGALSTVNSLTDVVASGVAWIETLFSDGPPHSGVLPSSALDQPTDAAGGESLVCVECVLETLPAEL